MLKFGLRQSEFILVLQIFNVLVIDQVFPFGSRMMHIVGSFKEFNGFVVVPQDSVGRIISLAIITRPYVDKLGILSPSGLYHILLARLEDKIVGYALELY